MPSTTDYRTDRELLEAIAADVATVKRQQAEVAEDVSTVKRQQALLLANVPVLRAVLGDETVRGLLRRQRKDLDEQAARVANGFGSAARPGGAAGYKG